MKTPQIADRRGEEGYLLLGLVVACFLLLLFLGVAAPRVAKQLERDREVESEHRALEYVRAIKLFYDKNHRYPTSVDELLGNATGGSGMSLGGTSLNVHYLRQKYTDPLTGGDYRPIHFGEAKTEVKGFFGEPLQGTPAGNLGAAAGMQSNLGNSIATSGTASSGTGSATSLTGSSSFGGSTAAQSGSGIASSSATTFQGSKGAIVGFGSDAKGHGLVEWNGSESIEDWEFLYDPRIELLKARVSIFGGTPAAAGTGSLGSGFAPASSLGGSTPSTGAGGASTGTPPANSTPTVP